MKTRGEHIAEAVREWLFANGLKQSQLTGAVLAEIADRTLAALEKAEKKKRRLAGEDEWIRDIEADAAMAGVDVRRSLAEAQFWARNNSRVCTRKFFTNWLLNPKNRPILNGGGHAPKAKSNGSAPAGWLAKLRELYPDSQYTKGGLHADTQESDYAWAQLAPIIRDELRKAL